MLLTLDLTSRITLVSIRGHWKATLRPCVFYGESDYKYQELAH